MTHTRRLTLEWDYEAEPLWEDGVDQPLSQIKDSDIRNQVRKWYTRFSRAEEVVDEVGSRPHSRAEVIEALIQLKELIPQGEKLAAKIGATLKVDYVHDPSLKEPEFEIFGKGNCDIEEWWKAQDRLPKRLPRGG